MSLWTLIPPSDEVLIQRLFSNGEKGGYWPALRQYAYEDSAGTTAASVNGVVGLRLNAIAGYPNAVQATTANKPYLRLTPTTNKPWYDSNTATGALTATFSGALGSACTVATVTPEGVTILENQTVGTTYNICPPYGYNSDVLIIDRAPTPAERALVTRVMQRSVPALGSELVVNGGFDSVADGVIGHDNGNGTVDGFSAQNNAYLSVVDGKLNVNSATSQTLCACWLQLAAQSANAALFIKAKMELKTGSNIYGFMVIRDNAPYTGYLSIFTSPSVINSSVIIPVSDISRIAFYATYYNAVNQTITVDDISAKVIL